MGIGTPEDSPLLLRDQRVGAKPSEFRTIPLIRPYGVESVVMYSIVNAPESPFAAVGIALNCIG